MLQPNMTLAEYEELRKKNKAPKAVKIVKESTKEDFSDMTPFTRKDRTADTDVLKLSNKKEISARKAGTSERERKTAVSPWSGGVCVWRQGPEVVCA